MDGTRDLPAVPGGAGPTKRLAVFAAGLSWDALDAEVRSAARRHLMDTLGVMVAGCAGEVATRLEHVLAIERGGGIVPVPGRIRRADRLDAAHIGGTGAHGIELDDGYRQGSVHPGVAVLPAALSVAYGRGVSGERLLEAVVAGYEAVASIARTVHPFLRRRGFHPTGTVGALGAAVAAGRILGLDAKGFEAALGLAASSAAGVFAFLGGGADVKRLHAGHAAREGLMAALLAAEGMEAPPDVLEAPDGFFQAFAFGRGTDATAVHASGFVLPPAAPFAITDCYIKPYACCRHIQPAVEALMALVSEHRLTETDVLAIEVETYAIASEHAHTGWGDFASAQLSFPFIMALGLRFGAVDLPHFVPEVRQNPDIARICARVSVRTDSHLDQLYPEFRPARVTVTTRNGRLMREAMEALGSRLVPLDDAGLHGKFHGLVAPVLGEAAARRLLTMLMDVEAMPDISPFMALAALPEGEFASAGASAARNVATRAVDTGGARVHRPAGA